MRYVGSICVLQEGKQDDGREMPCELYFRVKFLLIQEIYYFYGHKAYQGHREECDELSSEFIGL